ncbi:MAG: DUF4038 domain-containing protein [Planctomycetes bacterium]|nr:DUF4038 domain-containing protein [Planctomycetota bacterium]
MRTRFTCLGATFLSILLVGVAPAQEPAPGLPAGKAVARYDVFEAVLTSAKTYANPFLDVTVAATFTAPSGRKLQAGGFYDGGSTWRVRVAPDELGEWRYITQAGDGTDRGLHDRSGTFRCVRSSNKGFLRVDPKRKYSFSYSDGTPFFALGDTCTVTSKALSDASRKAYLDARARRPFNFLRMFASLTFNAWTGQPWGEAIARDADGFPWGGTPQAPDYDRLNPAYFQRYEKILGELRQRDVYAEIVVFNLYELPFKDPKIWTQAREELWGRYVVSRLSAYRTVFLWTVAQEYERHPAGRYRHEPADDDWVRRMAKLIRATDPHDHPITVHPVGDGGKPGEVAEVLMEGGAMGTRFGAGPELDVLAHQHNSYGTAAWVPDPAPGRWEGPAAGADKAVWADRKFGKPVINLEYGYEGLPGGDVNFNQQTHSPDKCRHAAWRIFTAGGAGLAAGFRGTTLSVDNAEIHYDKQQRFAPFQVADAGHVRDLQHLYNFVTVRTGFREMDPAQTLVNAPNLCLAHPGVEYVVYAPAGGEVSLDLTGTAGSFSVGRLNPRTGAYDGRLWVAGGARQVFSLPDANDWVLHLKKADDRSRAGWQERLERATRSTESWRTRREEIRRQILVAAGLWPEFERPPVKATVTGQFEREGYTLKKVYLETWPGFYLTGVLYLPKKTGPLPAVLCTHGHGKNGRFGTIEEQPRAITLARLGFVVFAYDMIGYGECLQLPHEFAEGSPTQNDALGSPERPWGLNLLGLQLWNSQRVVDFVSSLPEVDPQRIGVTGSSGGGTQTFLLTAVDDRIACAAPVCMVAAEFQGGCSCENAPGLRIGLNNVEIAAATAPRPLLLVSATGDWTKYNPLLEGPALHRVYEALGVADRFRCVQFVAPHNYNQDSREAVYPWLAHWLGQARGTGILPVHSQDMGKMPMPLERRAEDAIQAETHESLEVFSAAHPRPKHALDAAGLTAFLKDKIRRQLDALWPQDAASLERFRRLMTPALRYTLPAQWPDPDQIEVVTTTPAASGTRPFSRVAVRHRGLSATIELRTSAAAGDKRRASLLVASTAQEVESVLHQLQSVRATVFVLQLQPHERETASGGNAEQQRLYSSTYYRTALAWQVQDVLTALAYLVEREGFQKVQLAGLGEAGIPTLLARALAPTGKVGMTIADLAGLDGQDEKTWTGARTQPGILRCGGLTTAALLAAPDGLVLHNTGAHLDSSALRTVYQATGRAAALEISESAWSLGAILGCLGVPAAADDWHVWTVAETKHVLRSEPPGNDVAVDIAAARNEGVSFQILLRSPGPVKGVRVETGALRGPGGSVLSVSESRLYRQHQLHLEVGTHRNDAFQSDWYPDPLIPCEPIRSVPARASQGTPDGVTANLHAVPFDLPANETHGFWVDLHVPAGTPAGQYRGVYRVTAEDGRSVEVPVALTVWDFALPQTPTLVTAFGSPAQRMRDYYRQRAKAGKEPEPSDWQAVETQCAELLSEHGLNATPPTEMLRPVAQPDGSFQIPAEQVRALREFVDRYHVNALAVPHPSGVIKDPEAERGKLHAWLAAFDLAAKELGRPHVVFYVYLKDEPNSREDYEYVQKWGPAIRAAKSVVQVMVVEQTWTEPGQGGADSAWRDLYGAVDIWCPLFSLHRQESAARRQALGETIWAYTALCQGPPTPWWHIDYPLLNYRVPGWMAWRDRMKGLLYWGGMSHWRETDDPWLHAPVYTGRGIFQQGDKGIRFNGEGSLVYPARAAGYDGIVPTIRLKALRDAVEDYEYLALLDRMGRSADADRIVRHLTESWFRWEKDPVAYEKARAELAALILAVGPTAGEPRPAGGPPEPGCEPIVLDDSCSVHERDAGSIDNDGDAVLQFQAWEGDRRCG